MVYTGCADVGTDKSQQQKSLNVAEEHSDSMLSAECSNSAKCTTLPTPDLVSSQSEVSVENGGLSETCNMTNDSCVATTAGILCHSGTEAAEMINDGNSCPDGKSSSDKAAECLSTSNTAHSPVSPSSTHIRAADLETEDNSAAGPSQHSCLLTQVKYSCDKEQCQHDSNIHRLSQGCSNQSSIRSFFKPVSKAQQSGTTTVHSMKNIGPSACSHSCDVTLHENTRVQNNSDRNVDISHSLKTDANNAVPSASSSLTHKNRKCPFYKWISGKVLQ